MCSLPRRHSNDLPLGQPTREPLNLSPDRAAVPVRGAHQVQSGRLGGVGSVMDSCSTGINRNRSVDCELAACGGRSSRSRSQLWSAALLGGLGPGVGNVLRSNEVKPSVAAFTGRSDAGPPSRPTSDVGPQAGGWPRNGGPRFYIDTPITWGSVFRTQPAIPSRPRRSGGQRLVEGSHRESGLIRKSMT